MNSLLYPETQSPKELAVKFTPCAINKELLKQANEAARAGNFNLGNYLLTGAYQGGDENNAFWEQFL